MSSFCTAKATHIFSVKNFSISASLDVNFNESLTDDIVSFEQMGPVCLLNLIRVCFKLNMIHNVLKCLPKRQCVWLVNRYFLWNIRNKYCQFVVLIRRITLYVANVSLHCISLLLMASSFFYHLFIKWTNHLACFFVYLFFFVKRINTSVERGSGDALFRFIIIIIISFLFCKHIWWGRERGHIISLDKLLYVTFI